MSRDVLFELGVEELPSGAVLSLSVALGKAFEKALTETRLGFGEIHAFATPRRLAILVSALDEKQAAQTISKLGPKEAAGLDDKGAPSKALAGFARSCGVSVDDLKVVDTDKGPRFSYTAEENGLLTLELLPDIAQQVIQSLPIPKPMRWGDLDTGFVRPVHWLVFLWGESIVDATLFGCKADRKTYGHRYHHPGAITLKKPTDYEAALKEGYVIADFEKRRNFIQKAIEKLVSNIGVAVIPPALLDEVTSIVEWPVPLLVDFDKAFLNIPAEVLIASMQAHQKCFAVRSKAGKLLPHFITVSNIKSTSQKQVINGNARVMHARLSDAEFFYTEDKKSTLESRVKGTQDVVFQKDLGSLRDKTIRLEKLMKRFAPMLELDVKQGTRAAKLSKSDLQTGMVFEFPELQGTMGYYYALHDGEEKVLAKALEEQYLPRFSKDALPKSNLGLLLSLVDRIDTLVGIFSVGLKPTGEKDPFKLRRHALAIVRILNAIPVSLELTQLLEAVPLKMDKAFIATVKSFILERLPAYYQEKNYPTEWMRAATAKSSECLRDLDMRLNALESFMACPEAHALARASKRVSKILMQQDVTETSVDETLLIEKAEKALFKQVKKLAATVALQYEERAYGAILIELATLQPAVDSFFEHVMVMVEDESIKKNRLHLLAHLQSLLQSVVDVSLLPQA